MGKATGDEVVKRGGNAHLISSGRNSRRPIGGNQTRNPTDR